MNRVREVNELHQRAMEFADLALLAKLSGNNDESKRLFRDAFEHEAEAAGLVVANVADEPTRSVLHRSAAALALECNEVREAERLIATALAGDPPPEIANELRGLFEQVNFHRHLELQGISLNARELQLSVTGNAIGYGIALSEVVTERIGYIETLIHRTVERKLGRKYRESGRAAKSVTGGFSVYISTPRPGSFSLTLRLGGQETRQPELPGFQNTDITDQIIDELIECLSLVNKDSYDELKRKITDPIYYGNFVALARGIAPDGEKVSLVGITTVRGNSEETLSFTKTKDDIRLAPEPAFDETEDGNLGEYTTVTGYLRYADEIKENDIKLVEDDGKKHTITVPEGLMTDIVKPLWGDKVIIKGIRRGKKIILQSIDRTDE